MAEQADPPPPAAAPPPPPPARTKTVLSWSSGKDCSYALHVLRTSPLFKDRYDVVGLLSTVNESVTPNRVAMHGTRENLVRMQAERCSLPPPHPPLELHLVPLPSPCPNATYEARMGAAVAKLKAAGVGAMAFGDIFLRDVRAYREEKMRGSGLECVFPIWLDADQPGGKTTAALAREMIAAGLRAKLVCVDPRRLPGSLAGRTFDADFLEDLERLRREEKEKEKADDGKAAADPAAAAAPKPPPPPPPPIDDCGENGEFHTFAFAGPAFSSPIDVDVAPEPVELNGFYFCDVAPRGEMSPEAFREAAAAAKVQAEKNAEAMAKARAENECPVQTVAREKEAAAAEARREEEAAAAAGGD